jgi:hypothetical protein
MVQHIDVTLSIALARPSGYRVVYILRYGKASAASGLTIPRQAQLRAFLQHFGLAPEAIDQLVTKVHAGGTEQLTFGALDHDRVERILRRYAHSPPVLLTPCHSFLRMRTYQRTASRNR